MTQLDPQLEALGDRLEQAAAADLATNAQPAAKRPRRLSRRLILVAAVLAIAIPGVAIAAEELTSTSEVAQSMPAGTLALAGTEPTCTVVKDRRRVPLHAREGTSARGFRLEGHGRAERRREQARQRRLPFARERRPRVAVLHRPGRGRPEDHRPEPAGRIRAGAGPGLTRTGSGSARRGLTPTGGV